ncbi:MAG: 2,4-dienoyl-CoA reductase [Coriobacteriaceae bacterium]|nr:MAG: 2,4-dienoyl-CoA reductase [Coriobacteriaceae bacterium]
MALTNVQPQIPLSLPAHIGARMAPNRFWAQPMECNDADDDGVFTDVTLERYRRLLEGGFGVVEVEAVTLQRQSRARRTQLALDVDDPRSRRAWERFLAWKRDNYPQQLLVVQLHHSGELSDPSFSRRVCVKQRPGYGGDLIDEKYIDAEIDRCVRAANFLWRAGADGVDLKFCHGYLWSQVFRPYNDRAWRYGGSLAARSRALLELCERVRHATPDDGFLVGAKLSVWDEFPGGVGHDGPNSPIIDPRETIRLAQGLEARGASWFLETLGDCGCGWGLMCPDHYTAGTVMQHITAARTLRDRLAPQTTVICGGLSALRDGRSNGLSGVSPEEASLFAMGNARISAGDFNMVALGRQSLADPDTPRKYLEGEVEKIRWCTCCNHCGALEGGQAHVGCATYDGTYAKAYAQLSHRHLPCDA